MIRTVYIRTVRPKPQFSFGTFWWLPVWSGQNLISENLWQKKLRFLKKKALTLIPKVDLGFRSQSQFYIQLVNRPHEFFCLGCLGSQGSIREKSGLEEFWATFEGVFFNFWWSKQTFRKILNYCRVRTKKLHRIKVKKNW